VVAEAVSLCRLSVASGLALAELVNAEEILRNTSGALTISGRTGHDLRDGSQPTSKVSVSLCASAPDRHESRRKRDKAFCLCHRNRLFGDTANGAKASASLYRLVHTSRANELEPYAYLRRLFAGLPAARNVSDFEALLPFNFVSAETAS
jgi:IS66 C-terminal element